MKCERKVKYNATNGIEETDRETSAHLNHKSMYVRSSDDNDDDDDDDDEDGDGDNGSHHHKAHNI